MKEFLANIRPPKFLRYFFYIGYSWYRGFKSERDDAHVMATILLATFSGFPIFMLLSFRFGEIIDRINDYMVIVPFVTLLGLFFYYLFLYRRKWRYYLEEFKHKKRKERLIGIIYLFSYLCA